MNAATRAVHTSHDLPLRPMPFTVSARRAALAACLIAATACSDDSTNAPPAPVARTLSGSCTLTTRVATATARTLTWTCDIAPLGRATATQIETLDGATITGTSIRYLTADGDELRTTYTGTVRVEAGFVNFSGTEVVTTGTGRFATASGQLTRSGRVSLPGTNEGQYTTSGTVTY